MVDVSGKPETDREAIAEANVRMNAAAIRAIRRKTVKKGDPLQTARLAGMLAAKRTADLIPLCHPLPLDRVDVDLAADRDAGTVTVRAEARVTARTGVEMEAMVAASVAALTLYDMAKALQRDIVIEQVRLVSKSGGRSGEFGPAASAEPATHEAVVVTCSNRSAAGEREDTSGPSVVSRLQEAGFDVAPEALVVPDDEEAIAALLIGLADAGHRLILTTGGTGLSPTDVTPAATRRAIDREAPGLAELMRSVGFTSTPMAALSRAVVGSRGSTLIVNLPGSPKGAIESLDALLPVLRHALEQLAGGDH
jgi:cyclic pyranopterin phosphate synthase